MAESPGATNLGGAMLAVLAVTPHSEKGAVRYTVAHYCLAFAVIQCATLALSGNGAGLLHGALLAPVAAAVYRFVGNPIFARFDDRRYRITMTGFIFAYGLALVGRAFV